MDKKLAASKLIFWRFLPIVVGLLWILNYFFRIRVLGALDFEDSLISLNGHIVICGIFGLLFIITIFYPYQFYIHAAFCLLWGLIRLVDGGAINALLIHLFGYLFLYRQGFFNTGKWYKLLAGALVLLAAICSQIRLGHILFIRHLMQFVDFACILAIAGVVLSPEIKHIQKLNRDMLLRLTADSFTKKDVVILEKILAGEKYESIAHDTNMAVSTLKKHIHGLFLRLRVNDRISFMSVYAKHRIILEKN